MSHKVQALIAVLYVVTVVAIVMALGWACITYTTKMNWILNQQFKWK
jgi:hypothetical protein